MRRRKVLTTGAVVGLGFIAGCTGDGDGGNGDGDATTTSESTPEPPDEPEAGEVTFSVEPSTDELEWGEEYTVTITAQAGDDPPDRVTAIAFHEKGDTQWSGPLGDSEQMWSLEAGESRTETFETEPPGLGEFELGLMNDEGEEVTDPWSLSVTAPQLAFGDSFTDYDGLAMTIEPELIDELEFMITDLSGDEIGEYNVSPIDGKWLKLWVTIENTADEEVRALSQKDIEVLANGKQVEYIFENGGVGPHSDFEVLDPSFEGEQGDRFFFNQDRDHYPTQAPGEMVPGASFEGWVPYVVYPEITTDDLLIRAVRNDVRITWE